jgi:hypothetical protein
VALGVKVTLIVQLEPAATLAPQLLVWPKSPALAPVNPMLLMVKTAPLVFASVTPCAALLVPTFWLPNVSEPGVSLGSAVPVPVKLTVCGLPAALSVMLTLPLRVPMAVGRNVTLRLQLPFTARVAGLKGQLCVSLKSPAFAPPTTRLVILKGALPPFVSVTPCAGLLLFTSWPLNVSMVGASPTAAAIPLPLTPAVWGLLPALSVTVRLALRVPVALGVKVTLIVQLEPAATLAPQLLVWPKSPALAPLNPILLILIDEPVPFFSVSGCAALVAPTS